MDTKDHDSTAAARILYSAAIAAGCATSEEGPFVYDKKRDAFFFTDGRFAFDRERADRWLAMALKLGPQEWHTPRSPSGLMLHDLPDAYPASPEDP